jgi:hypothetical protein
VRINVEESQDSEEKWTIKCEGKCNEQPERARAAATCEESKQLTLRLVPFQHWITISQLQATNTEEVATN